MLDMLIETLEANQQLFWILGLGSVALLIGTALFIPWLIIILPADFFARKLDGSGDRRELGVGRILLIILRNLIGVVFFVAGIIMLFIPGQGLLTILIGLALIDFPGKNTLLRRLVRNRRVFDTANGIRRWAGRPDFLPGCAETRREPAGRES